jgi:hypothetical protein
MNYSFWVKILGALCVILVLQGCVSTIVGAVVDTTIEVVKIPFKVGGAIIDAASSKEDDKKTKPNKE